MCVSTGFRNVKTAANAVRLIALECDQPKNLMWTEQLVQRQALTLGWHAPEDLRRAWQIMLEPRPWQSLRGLPPILDYPKIKS